MSFDPEAFGIAMGEIVREAVEPLQNRIASLEKELADMASQLQSEVHAWNEAQPEKGEPGRDGKDCDMAAVKAMIEEAVNALPAPVAGKDGADGKDGKDGEKGADGAGIADLLTDRDGALVATFTDGRMKNLGVIMGKDGRDGIDGKDGVSFDSFELEYLPESHEVAVKASAAGRTKELRFPAGGIRPAGYWREGIKAKANEAWVHDGSTWYAVRDTETKPESKSADWIIGARRGRDGETVVKTVRDGPPPPIKLGG